MPRQLKGTLEDFHTTQLMHLINLAKKTGTLHIYEPVSTGRQIDIGDGMTKRAEMAPGKERAKVAFKEGKLIHAATQSQDGHLATVLHKSGKLNDQQYKIIREKAAGASDKALALRLINANYVSQQDIIQSIQAHTLEIVYEIMSWRQEPFMFEEAEQPPPERITIPMDLENVIIEGTRRNIEHDRLMQELPNLDLALRFPEAPTEKLKGIKLSNEEWRVVALIDGKKPIKLIAKERNMTDMEIRQIVYRLMSAGLVEVIKPATTNTRGGTSRARPGSTPPPKPVINKLIDRIKNL